MEPPIYPFSPRSWPTPFGTGNTSVDAGMNEACPTSHGMSLLPSEAGQIATCPTRARRQAPSIDSVVSYCDLRRIGGHYDWHKHTMHSVSTNIRALPEPLRDAVYDN